MTRLGAILAILALGPMAAPAEAAGKIYYGPRQGQTVSIVSTRGLGTADAVIRVRHTRADAVAFCRDFVGRVTEACVREELATSLSDEVKGNCVTGVFTAVGGGRYQLIGRNQGTAAPHFQVMDLDAGEALDDSTQSGYTVVLGVYDALCPGRLPPAKDW